MFQTAHRWFARRINGLTFGDLLLTPRFERGGMVEKGAAQNRADLASSASDDYFHRAQEAFDQVALCR